MGNRLRSRLRLCVFAQLLVAERGRDACRCLDDTKSPTTHTSSVTLSPNCLLFLLLWHDNDNEGWWRASRTYETCAAVALRHTETSRAGKVYRSGGGGAKNTHQPSQNMPGHMTDTKGKERTIWAFSYCHGISVFGPFRTSLIGVDRFSRTSTFLQQKGHATALEESER